MRILTSPMRTFAVALLALLVFPPPGNAQLDSTNKITFIVGFAAGGVADTLARLIAQGMSERLSQTVIVENHAGAGGNIAAALVARATADGTTLLVTTTSLAINETLSKNKRFSSSDFKTIAIVASSPESLSTSPSSVADNLPDFIKAMSGRPINFGSAGVGSSSHIATEYFLKFLAKAPATHIPFQGGAPAMNAMIGNQIDLLAGTLGGGFAAQIAAGKLKGLGIAADKRSVSVPNVRTFAEQGFSGFTATTWVGVFAPAKTDPAIAARLNAAINQIVNDPNVQAKLAAIGFEPSVASLAEATTIFDQDVRKWGDMVRALNLASN
jgi:tripartite-type tricarboxylate transporter receptor subunit TctC